MPELQNRTNNITLHLNRIVTEEMLGGKALDQLIDLEISGNRHAPKAFWMPDGELVCAVVNEQALPPPMDLSSFSSLKKYAMPPQWQTTQAHRIDAARAGEEARLINACCEKASVAYRCIFREPLPEALAPRRFCASVNRAASLHADADKAPIAFLFSFQRDSPGYIVFPRFGLRVWLEPYDVMIFDPRIHHASWTLASDPLKRRMDVWRTNVTLFRDTRHD